MLTTTIILIFSIGLLSVLWIYKALGYGKTAPMLFAIGTCILLALGLCTTGINYAFWQNETPSTRGAMLAGVFTGAAAFFTLANLIYSAERDRQRDEELREEKRRQQKKDQEQTDFIQEQTTLIRQQMEMNSLQRYVEHRHLFNDLLDQLESEHDNRFRFANRDKLYKAVFPKNSLKKIELSVPIGAEKTKPGTLKDTYEGYYIFAKKMEKLSCRLDPYKAQELALNYIQLTNLLEINYLEQSELGDIYFSSHFCGLNLFNASKAVRELENILSQLLIFSGNEEVSPCSYHAETFYLKLSFFKFADINYNEKLFTIFDYNRRISNTFRLLTFSDQRPNDKRDEILFSTLWDLFGSFNKVQKFKNNTFFHETQKSIEELIKVSSFGKKEYYKKAISDFKATS